MFHHHIFILLQVRGPPAKAAFDASGNPTKALEGFCKKAGVSVDSVIREADAKGVEYCFVEVKDAGKSAVEVGAGQHSLCTLPDGTCTAASIIAHCGYAML